MATGLAVLKRPKLTAACRMRTPQKSDQGKSQTRWRVRVEGGGELVIVHRVTAAEEAEEVLVDEVEPEEAVAVHASGVAEAGEDVPGSGD